MLLSSVASVHTILEYSESRVRTYVYVNCLFLLPNKDISFDSVKNTQVTK